MNLLRIYRVTLLAPVFALAAALPSPVRAQVTSPVAPPAKVVVVNPSRIFNEMLETKSLQARMKDEQEKFEKDRAAKTNALTLLKQQRDNFKPDTPQYNEKNDAMLNDSVQFKVWMDSQRAMAEHMQKRQMKTLFEKIQNAVAEVAKQNGIDIVIADPGDQIPDELDNVDIRALRGAILQKNVLYHTDRVDISQAVLALLDARFKSGGGGGAAGVGGGVSGGAGASTGINK